MEEVVEKLKQISPEFQKELPVGVFQGEKETAKSPTPSPASPVPPMDDSNLTELYELQAKFQQVRKELKTLRQEKVQMLKMVTKLEEKLARVEKKLKCVQDAYDDVKQILCDQIKILQQQVKTLEEDLAVHPTPGVETSTQTVAEPRENWQTESTSSY